jgi:hypothetical protein
MVITLLAPLVREEKENKAKKYLVCHEYRDNRGSLAQSIPEMLDLAISTDRFRLPIEALRTPIPTKFEAISGTRQV